MLIAGFRGDIVTPSSAEYPAAISRWAKNAERNAKIVAFVRDADDVVLAINHAKLHRLPIAIRGGGHSSSGSSSSEGLVIDLHRYLRNVSVGDIRDAHPELTVDPSTKVATVGGGAIWQDVDEEAIKHGYATVGGTVNHTGVGGLSLGGGFGYLTGLHGLTVDNILKVQVVTGNGEILNASADENDDLFFGVRGGGSNFGVITQFVYRLHEQPPTIFAGEMLFPTSLLPQLSEAIRLYVGAKQPPNSSLFMLIASTHNGPILAVVFTYNGPEDEARKAFAPLYALKPVVDTTAMIPYEQVNALVNKTNVHGECVYRTGTVHRGNDIALYQKILQTTVELYEKYPDFTAESLVDFVPLDKVMEVPDESMAFPRNPYPNIVIVSKWKQCNDDNAKIGKQIASAIRDAAASDITGLSEHAKCGYVNNYHESAQTNTRSQFARDLFGSKYPKLQRLKRKHDPEQLFNKFAPIEI